MTCFRDWSRHAVKNILPLPLRLHGADLVPSIRGSARHNSDRRLVRRVEYANRVASNENGAYSLYMARLHTLLILYSYSYSLYMARPPHGARASKVRWCWRSNARKQFIPLYLCPLGSLTSQFFSTFYISRSRSSWTNACKQFILSILDFISSFSTLSSLSWSPYVIPTLASISSCFTYPQSDV